METTRDKISKLLLTPLDTDSPENLYKQAAEVESYIYLAITEQAAAETRLAGLESAIRLAGEHLKEFTGSQPEKKAQFEAKYSQLYEERDRCEAEYHFWLNICKAIERKINLAQTVLSSIKASINAGIRA